MCGLQTQHAPSGYVGMWSRAAALRRADLTAALERAEVVQGWVMRNTIHMVAAVDYGPFTDAVRHARRAQWLRADKRAVGLDMPAVADAVRRYLADGPLTQPRLVALLESDGFPRAGFPRVAWVGAQLWVDLLRVPPGRHLGEAARAPVRACGACSRRRDDAACRRGAGAAQLLPEAYRSRVFATSMPRSVPTFLVDGQVAGTWAYTGGQVVTSPFHDLSGADRRAVDAEAERLAAFHATPD